MSRNIPQMRRMQHIHQALRKGAYPNCATLARELETSPKTIQRDMQYLLNERKAPIAYDAARHGYYYTDSTYDLPAMSISEGDLFAIAVAEKALAQYRGTPLYERLHRVFARIREALPEKVTMPSPFAETRFSFADAPATRIDPAIWERLARALRCNCKMRLTHRDPTRGRAIERVVDPYHMTCFKGEWYLLGYDHYRKAIRRYGVSRILAAEVLDAPAEGAEAFDAQAYIASSFGAFPGEKEQDVALWFSPKVAPFIRERSWHATQRLRESKDGSVVLTMRLNHLLEVRQWVLSWGGEAKALAPKALREEVQAELTRASALYARKRTDAGATAP